MRGKIVCTCGFFFFYCYHGVTLLDNILCSTNMARYKSRDIRKMSVGETKKEKNWNKQFARRRRRRRSVYYWVVLPASVVDVSMSNFSTRRAVIVIACAFFPYTHAPIHFRIYRVSKKKKQKKKKSDVRFNYATKYLTFRQVTVYIYIYNIYVTLFANINRRILGGGGDQRKGLGGLQVKGSHNARFLFGLKSIEVLKKFPVFFSSNIDFDQIIYIEIRPIRTQSFYIIDKNYSIIVDQA